MKTKRKQALLTAAMLCVSALSLPTGTSAAADEPIKVEFESGVLEGCKEREPITWEKVDEDGFGNPCDMTGWSGDSYVYIDQKDAMVTVTVDIPKDGFYALNINYIQCFGNPEKPDKTQYLLVNGESQGEVLFPFNSGKGWQMLPAGYVHLNKGKNTISIKSYWGYTFLDCLTLTEAPAYLTNFSPADAPCNPNASPEARKLYAYLRSVYGKHVISGQQEYCGSHCYNKDAYKGSDKPINYFENNEEDFKFLEEVTGKQPAIRGIDLLFYTSTTQNLYDDAPERIVSWYKDKGGIPTVSFHWNVPTEKGSNDVAFYVKSAANGGKFTTFSATNALKEGTWEHERIDADIKVLAEQLGKARDAGVPVLFRPLHEAEGAWFWWGAEGPEACKNLYYYLYDKLTNEYKLNNLLWIWTGSTSAHASEWYPGDEYVDFQGCDKYNVVTYGTPNLSSVSATFYSLVAQTEGRKMVCMSENDTIPSLDNVLRDKAAWLYFCPWYHEYLTAQNDKAELKKMYTSEYCITLDELPDWDTYDPKLPAAAETSAPAVTTVKAETVTTTNTTTGNSLTTAKAVTTSASDAATTASQGTKALVGDTDCSGNVDVADAVLLARYLAEDKEASVTAQGKLNADCDGKAGLSNDDTTRILRYIAKLITKEKFESKS